jgi:hypothetical protein
MVESLKEVRGLGNPGAAQRAARIVMSMLQEKAKFDEFGVKPVLD